MDVEVDTGDRWMEVASISERISRDVVGKSGTQIDVKVLEIAMGLDRFTNGWIADERNWPDHAAAASLASSD